MSARETALDRLPKAAIIITAFNYEMHIEGAIRSVLEQTHQNFELVVVDDHSATASAARTRQIVESFNDERISLVRNETNIGQTHGFYAGMDRTDAEFVCLLDPDDRYFPGFLEQMLTAHLNSVHIAPLAFCNQQLMRGDSTRLTAGQSSLMAQHFAANRIDELESNLHRHGFSCFIPATTGGWIWTSTTSMMFRRDALEMIRPLKQLAYKAFADTYLANGAHLLGGTLFVHTTLVSRLLHDQNAFSHARVFAGNQKWGSENLMGGNPKRDAVEALFDGGNAKLLRKKNLKNALLARLSPVDIFQVWRKSKTFRSDMGCLIVMLSWLRFLHRAK